MCRSVLVLLALTFWISNAWSFRLSLNDYEIRSDRVVADEMGEVMDLMREDLEEGLEDGEGLLNGDEEILLIDTGDVEKQSSSQAVSDKRSRNLKNFYSIPELNQHRFNHGTYETEGYVTFIYTCACIQVATCKPCMDDNIIVSDSNALKPGYDLTNEDLIIFLKEKSRFQSGKRYRFIVQILDVKSTAQILNNIRLIYYEKLEN